MIENLTREKTDQVADLIIIDNIALLEESINHLSDTGTIWLFYKMEDLETVIDKIVDSPLFIHLENATVFTIGNETLQAYHLTKDQNNYTLNTIEVKRDVVVPYTVMNEDGNREKRGWDYEDGVAKRWTGLGNSVYLSDVTFLPQLLSMLSSKEGDIVTYNGDTVIRDYSIMDGILSTSEEDCPLSFYNRKFLPKTREE